MRRPQTNGFVERFNRTVLNEFFRKAFREKLYESVEALQRDLDEWLSYYNGERPHQGYRRTWEGDPYRGSTSTYKMYGKKVESTGKGEGCTFLWILGTRRSYHFEEASSPFVSLAPYIVC